MAKAIAVFMVGGPGAGKSFVRDRDFAGVKVVDCDLIKESHPEYDPKNPSALHEWSRVECAKSFFLAIGGDDSFVYDGTGTNAEKMVDWMLKAQEAGFSVQLVYVRCPIQTALRRNAERTRVVPESIVREKHASVETSFNILSGYADSITEVQNG